MKPTDLRGILHYVPQFRDRVFVIAVDGAIVADDNFGNLLLDLAVLRSLNIHVVLVHGAGWQVQQLAQQSGAAITNWDGTGVTDAATLRLAITAAHSVTHEILEGLSVNNLRAAHTNCIEAVPLGILKGVDHQHTGKVHRVDVELLRLLLDKGVVPVVPPLGFDGNGHTYRLNSDAVAVEVARELGAVKLLYLAAQAGLEVEGRLRSQMPVAELAGLLKTAAQKIAPAMVSKARNALLACEGGVPRVHLMDGRVDEGLLAEVFSNEGIGTLIYANEYQAIRKASRKDVRHIMTLIRPSIQGEQLVKRTRASVEKQIGEFYVFEIDNNIVGCVAVQPFAAENKSELYCLQVNPAHEHRGIGTKLARYAEAVARDLGHETLFALSTQAFSFFQDKLGYREGTVQDLPAGRAEKYEQSGRNSKILIKTLPAPGAAPAAGK